MPRFRPSGISSARAAGSRAAAAVGVGVVLAVLAAPAADAQPRGDRPMLLVEPGSIEILGRARASIFALDIDGAERELATLAARPDGAVAAWYHRSLSSLLVALLDDEDAAWSRFFSRSDSLRRRLDHAPRGAWRDLLEAEVDYQRAVAWAKRGRYARAAMAASAAFRGYSRTVERYPHLADARKGTGLFEALVGALPDTYRRFLTLFGFPGDFSRGTAALVDAARGDGYFSDEASLYLGMLGLFEFPVPVDALAELRAVYSRTGRSPLVALPLLETLLRRRRVAEAEDVLKDVARRMEEGRTMPVAYLAWFEGECAYRRDAFDAAAAHFERYVRIHRGPALKAHAWMRLGQSHDLSGRRSEAVAAYREVVAAREFDSDAAAARFAAERLRAAPSDDERTLWYAANAFDRDDPAIAEEMLRGLVERTALDPGLRAEALYRLGRVAEERRSDDEAVAWYRRAVDAGGDAKDRWKPTSWYRIARIEEARGNRSAARAALERLLEVEGDYDYRGQLRRQAETRLAGLR